MSKRFSAPGYTYTEDFPRARGDDPHTSHIAAERVDEFDARLFDVIARALTASGQTSHEIAAACGLTETQVHKRLPEMQTKGTAIILRDATGEPLTRKGPSGRPCRLWAAPSRQSTLFA